MLKCRNLYFSGDNIYVYEYVLCLVLTQLLVLSEYNSKHKSLASHVISVVTEPWFEQMVFCKWDVVSPWVKPKKVESVNIFLNCCCRCFCSKIDQYSLHIVSLYTYRCIYVHICLYMLYWGICGMYIHTYWILLWIVFYNISYQMPFVVWLA